MSENRLNPLTPEALDADQRALYDAVRTSPRAQGAMGRLLTRDDGSLVGPFDAWLRSPVLGALFEQAGMALRTETAVPTAAREVAILVVARAWSADFEWWAHRQVVRNEGVPEAVIDAIAQRRPLPTEDPAINAAHNVAVELVHKRALQAATLERAKAVLGERGLVEVVLAVGFYQLVSGTLESFHPPPPTGVEVEGPPPIAEHAGFDLYQAASTLRAVRRLKSDPIPEATLRRVLQAATWAPSGGNRQPWQVIAVRDPAIKRQLGELYQPLWSAYTEPYHQRLQALPEPERRSIQGAITAGDYLAEHLQETPVIAVFCFDPGGLAITDAHLDRPSVVGGGSLYPAVQNLLLACRAEGLGCVLTTLLCGVEEAVRELLAIPDPWATYAHVPIGWPVGGHGPIARRPVESVAYADQFGEPLFPTEPQPGD